MNEGGDNLFQPVKPIGSTSNIAGQVAAMKSGSRRVRIMEILREQPRTLWEVADLMGVKEHTISGRFTELDRDLLIQRTGERRGRTPESCQADVWRVSGASYAPGVDLRGRMGYPTTLKIGSELFDRSELLPCERWPGIPFVRRADAGGARQVVRVELVECPGCGRSLKYSEEKLPDGTTRKQFRCGTPSCNQTAELVICAEPGKQPILTLIMRSF